MQIKNSHKVITGITFLVALLLVTAFKLNENIGQVQNAFSAKTRARSFHIDIRILVMSDKIEALKEIIAGWPEAGE